MGFFDKFKKKNTAKETPEVKNTYSPISNAETEEYINDVTFIRDMKHIPSGPWHQYDILLAAAGYDWKFMIDWADYMASADLEQISQVTAGSINSESNDITESYKNSNCKCADTKELQEEIASLSIAGISETLKAPMKIVWFNQTKILRFFTIIDDDTLIKKYAEAVVRRTFGTPDAMKLAKPIPSSNN